MYYKPTGYLHTRIPVEEPELAPVKSAWPTTQKRRFLSSPEKKTATLDMANTWTCDSWRAARAADVTLLRLLKQQ